MKALSITLLLILISLNTMAQVQQTFIYEITLYERFRHQSSWSETEHEIQKKHIEYLAALTKSGSLQLAGITSQGLEDHTGFIILTTESYEKANSIAQNDPSVKEGMMSVKLKPVNIYFKKEN